MLCSAYFVIFIQPETPACAMVPPKFKGFPLQPRFYLRV